MVLYKCGRYIEIYICRYVEIGEKKKNRCDKCTFVI